MYYVLLFTILLVASIYSKRRVLVSDESVPFKVTQVADETVDKTTNLFFIILLMISLWWIYDTIYVFYNSSAGNISGYRPTRDNPTAMKDLSDDVVAWISIEDSPLDYPIMQGEDNTEYLNKDPFGEYSLAGSVFLDSRNSSDFSDEYSLVYGHHMEGGLMFGCLDKWEDAKYFKEHLNGTLTLVSGKEYHIDFFAYAKVDASDDIIFDVAHESTINDRIKWVTSKALNKVNTTEGRLIALSTCASPLTTERKILIGVIRD